KLLQIVNSAYFGFGKPISSVAAAVSYVGVDLLKAMALMVGIFRPAPTSITVLGFSVEESQQQALLVAQIARRIVTDKSRRDEAFTTGVLHDVGKLILATRVPEAYAAILREGITGEKPLHQLETEALGASHALIGAVLLGAWGLPYSMVQSVAYHHNLRTHHAIDDAVTVAVHVADAFVSAHLSGHRDVTLDLDIEALSAHGLLPQLEEWTAIANEIMEGVSNG
ncbi:MAG: HDOD domain-containing protein, partial [Gemmatimonadaceae bacterium]